MVIPGFALRAHPGMTITCHLTCNVYYIAPRRGMECYIHIILGILGEAWNVIPSAKHLYQLL